MREEKPVTVRRPGMECASLRSNGVPHQGSAPTSPLDTPDRVLQSCHVPSNFARLTPRSEAEADPRRAVLPRLKRTFIHLLLLVIIPLSAASDSPPSRSANRRAASFTRAISMGKRPGTQAGADDAGGKRRAPGDTSTGEAAKLGSPLSPSVLVGA